MDRKTLGIVETVVGAALAIWTYTRFTNLMGQMHSWSPPFDSYEVTTLVVGGLGALFVIAGLVNLTRKTVPPPPPA